MQDEIFDMLLNEEEISWKSILYDLVKTEKMDPWNVNITLLTQKYLQVVAEMKEHNLRISGKILLAAAFLLRIKSSHLLDNDISKLDQLINQTEEAMFDEELSEELLALLPQQERKKKEEFTLIPRNPQPRNRKVSIHDLVSALQKAMSTRKRALQKIKPVKFDMPKKSIDIMEVIRDVYHKVQFYTKKDKTKKLSFKRLLPPKPKREDKVYTFIPLLHLENQHKVGMQQEDAFEEIFVELLEKKAKKA